MMASRKTRRRTAWVALLVALCCSILSGCSTSGALGLKNENDGGVADCQPGVDAKGWTRLEAGSIEFGLGIYKLPTRKSKVYVVSAALLQPQGGITLVDVGFQAFDGVGTGVDWSSSVQAIDGAGHPVPTVRRALPAELTFTPPTGANAGNDGRKWQLAVGLRASGEGGMAQGVTFTYIYRGQVHTAVDHHPVGVFRTSAQCDSVVLPRD
jgi:hypothetical protein